MIRRQVNFNQSFNGLYNLQINPGIKNLVNKGPKHNGQLLQATGASGFINLKENS